MERLHWYHEKEEKINIQTHALGILLSGIGLFLLILKSIDYQFDEALSLVIYGISQILIFSSSTYYHSCTIPQKRYVANIVDHAMIYVSIAGTYTPFCVISLQKNGGGSLLILVWIFAIIGILLKLKFTGKYNLLSTIIYVIMGWLVVFYGKSFLENIPLNGIILLVAGGIVYTLGAIFYLIQKFPYNHAVFHVFILIASILHFLAIYLYT
ncbi:MAG: hemolysin III family protein [Flavobacteriaceae bacterium]|nr:hemolysin III family protein [Flavobacteriaceae bacterium]